MTYDPTSISPTARIVAQRRTYSDIPFATETAQILEEISQDNGDSPLTNELIRPDLAPRVEARYKLTEQLLQESVITNVLELAAGFSSRGMVASQGVQYVELDLPIVIQQKKVVAARILGDGVLQKRANLHFVVGDVLDPDDLRKAANLLPASGPIAIICEGLLRYFTLAQKRALATEIKMLLVERGGVWITPDISPKSAGGFTESTLLTSHARNIASLTGVGFEQNRFETSQEAREFYEELGFAVEEHLFTTVMGRLVTPGRLGLSEAETLDAIMPGVAFMMRASEAKK